MGLPSVDLSEAVAILFFNFSKARNMSDPDAWRTSYEGKHKLWSPPFDGRSPNTNQARNCWQNYVDFHRCQKVKGEDYEPCNYFQKVYKNMCPTDWYERFDEQMSEGRFPGKI